MKYKITKSDLFINNKLHSEGSEIELTSDQTKGIENFLIPIEAVRHTKRSRSISEASTKTKKNKGNKK